MGWYIVYLMYTGVYGGIFILIHCIARRWSPQKWSKWNTLVVLWGIVYALTAVFYGYPALMLSRVFTLYNFDESILGAISSIGIPSLITVFVTAAAWRSKPIAWSIGIGTLLACSISLLTREVGSIFIAPAVWNFCYAFGCCVQNTRDMKQIPKNLCNECGYDLFGLALDTVCPECGYQANRASCCPTCGQTIPAESQSTQ